jgi:hypothetical protein
MRRVHTNIVPVDLNDAMNDNLPCGRDLQGLVMLACDEDMSVYCSEGQVEDVWGGISHLVVIAEDLYCDAQDLSSPFLFFVAIICLIPWVEHGDGTDDVGSIDCHPLYLSQGGFIWG